MTTEVGNPGAYDPGSVDREQIRIHLVKTNEDGSETVLHDASYTAAERKRSMLRRVDKLESKLAATEGDDDAAALIGAMLAAMLDGAAGLEKIITAAWKQDAVSMDYLIRACAWVQRQQQERVAAGEA
jgi:hypothetical protein